MSFGDPKLLRAAAHAPRNTHSAAIRTRSGDTVISQLDLPQVGPGPCKYNVSTLPTHHGMLPMSPSAMLQGNKGASFMTTQARSCHDPPNVLWLLRADGNGEYRKELQPTPRVLSSPMCVPHATRCLPCPRARPCLQVSWARSLNQLWLSDLAHRIFMCAFRSPRVPHAPVVDNRLSASQQGGRRLLTPTERKHKSHLAMTRFCPPSPGVPSPFVPWGSVQATARTANPAGSPAGSPAADTPSPPKSEAPSSPRQPWPGSAQHVKYFPQTLRPYHGNPMRLLAPTPDGKRKYTSNPPVACDDGSILTDILGLQAGRPTS